MKVLIIGVIHAEGVAKKSGANYSMDTMHVCSPVENVASSTRTLYGYGNEPGEMECTAEVVRSAANMKFPGWYEVTTDVKMRFGRPSTFATSIKPLSGNQAKEAG